MHKVPIQGTTTLEFVYTAATFQTTAPAPENRTSPFMGAMGSVHTFGAMSVLVGYKSGRHNLNQDMFAADADENR